MNKLINIKNEDGIQAVWAKELYLGLGLNKTQWSRWYPTNIEQNDFFEENVDWTGVRHDVEGNETMDFLISIEFAKHIAMMAKTEKSYEYRNYFLECEKQVEQKLLTPKEQLKLQLQILEEQDKKIEVVSDRLSKVENTMTIDYSQQQEMNSKAKNRVVTVLGGKDTPAYKELNKKAFSSIWRDYQRVMAVNSYRNTAVKNYINGMAIIQSWIPCRELELMIKGCNLQIGIKEMN